MAIRISLDNAISTVPAAFGLVEISALTMAISDILRCVDMTIGILIIEVKTVAAVPTTLDSVVISAVTVAVADPSSSPHDAIGKIFDGSSKGHDRFGSAMQIAFALQEKSDSKDWSDAKLHSRRVLI